MKAMRCVAIVLLALWGGVAAGPAAAQGAPKDPAGTFVQTLGDRAIAIITDKALTPADREARFHDMFVKSFDVPAIGRFVLGRHWRTATEAQRTEFLKLFENMIVKIYSNRFNDYKGEQFNVTSSRSTGDSVMVGVAITRPSGGEPVRVDWRVLMVDGAYKVIDVVVEGVSMSLTQQQDFSAVIQRNGGQIEPLLGVMRERIEKAAPPTRS
jgi:phospholipid transport system substrate-binding protein